MKLLDSVEKHLAQRHSEMFDSALEQALKINPARKRIEWFLYHAPPGKFRIEDLERILKVSNGQVRYAIRKLNLMRLERGWYLTPMECE